MGKILAIEDILWVCKNGHKVQQSYNTTVTNQRGCRVCYESTSRLFGYYPERKDEIDTLYIIKFEGSYIKVGRSFDVDSRLKSLSQKSGIPRDKLEVLYTFKDTHQNIFEMEQSLHKILREMNLKHKEVWCKRELFSLESLSFLKSYFPCWV